ncbi:hypothetical protein KP509_34G023500 [Ceratopteris richardii]|uniref:Uncharacterized protein n=1 Tax=Ceratopteris richardii TaxID=49495 RepID=A0A8T2QJ10_CERRI|nr:hypothetical protein KP509_34G023500 [Ceratopteris richardii]
MLLAIIIANIYIGVELVQVDFDDEITNLIDNLLHELVMCVIRIDIHPISHQLNEHGSLGFVEGLNASPTRCNMSPPNSDPTSIRDTTKTISMIQNMAHENLACKIHVGCYKKSTFSTRQNKMSKRP